jgi:hypothetical protein
MPPDGRRGAASATKPTKMLDYHGDAPCPCPRCKGSTKHAIVLHAGQHTTAPPQTRKRDLQR